MICVEDVRLSHLSGGYDMCRGCEVDPHGAEVEVIHGDTVGLHPPLILLHNITF